MIKRICLGLLLSICIALPLSVHGQIGVSFGPHVGIQKAQDAEKSNFLVGATMRLRFMSALGAEGNISYRQEDFAANSFTSKSWPVTVTGLLYPLPFLYGGVGAGWYNTTFDFDDATNNAGFEDRTEQEFGWHLAVGLELPASPSIALFGDVRYVFLDYNLKDVPSAVLNDVNADFYSINAGLLFRL